MPPFDNQPPQIRPCEGPCGRMTRNTKMSKAKYPDTVTRVTATHCQACNRALVDTGDADLPAKEAAREARKLALQEERQAAAHRARQAIEVERAARALRRIPRRVGLGQSGVRI